MKKLFAMTIVIVGLAFPGLGQDSAKKEPPTLSPSQVVLEAWNDIGRRLIAMA